MRRRATATVELAVTLPALILLVFGAIEIANFIFLKQAATLAAYETARAATSRGASAAYATGKGQQALASRNVSQAQVDLSPQVTTLTPSGTELTATVTVPSSSNTFGFAWFTGGYNVVASVKMIRF